MSSEQPPQIVITDPSAPAGLRTEPVDTHGVLYSDGSEPSTSFGHSGPHTSQTLDQTVSPACVN